MAEVDIMWSLRTVRKQGRYCSTSARSEGLEGSWISRTSAVRNHDVTKRTDVILRGDVSDKGDCGYSAGS